MRSAIPILVIALAGCSDPTSPEAAGSVIPTPDDLLSAPSALTINGRTYELRPDLWRDFMPVSPPDGQPLIALVRLVEVDSLAIPSDVTMDYLWVVHGAETWATEFSDENVPPPSANTIARIARGGPKWGPGVTVDVVARVRVGNSDVYSILSRDQMISRTD